MKHQQVDLSTIKVGDEVLFRDGSTGTVKQVPDIEKITPFFLLTILSHATTELRQYVYDIHGRIAPELGDAPRDICSVTPAPVDISWLKAGDFVVLANGAKLPVCKVVHSTIAPPFVDVRFDLPQLPVAVYHKNGICRDGSRFNIVSIQPK